MHTTDTTSTTGGVTGYSSITGGMSFIVFASTKSNTEVEDFLTEAGIGYKLLFGAYKGEIEHAYIVNMEHLHRIRSLIECQESILVLGHAGKYGHRPASLYYLDGLDFVGTDSPETIVSICTNSEEIGDFQTCSREHAFKQDAWTQDLHTGEYYVCE